MRQADRAVRRWRSGGEAHRRLLAAIERLSQRRPGRPKVIQSADEFVDAAGLVYATDYNAWLSIIAFSG